MRQGRRKSNMDDVDDARIHVIPWTEGSQLRNGNGSGDLCKFISSWTESPKSTTDPKAKVNDDLWFADGATVRQHRVNRTSQPTIDEQHQVETGKIVIAVKFAPWRYRERLDSKKSELR